MAWRLIATLPIQKNWITLDEVIFSSLIRVSYGSLNLAPGKVLGLLRQRWDPETVDSHWLNLYPKISGDREIYELPLPAEFANSGLIYKQLEIRKWAGNTASIASNYTVTIEDWI